MTSTLDQAVVAQVLPGSWVVGASNIADWTDGDREEAEFRFELDDADPLVVLEEQTFRTADGKSRTIAMVSRFSGGTFLSKGRGLLRGGGSRWRLGGVSADGSIALIRMIHPRGGQDGLLLLVRQGFPIGELRRTVASDAAAYGVGPEDFASLSWLDRDDGLSADDGRSGPR